MTDRVGAVDRERRRAQQRAQYAADPDKFRARSKVNYAALTPRQRAAKRRQSADARRGNPTVLDQRRAYQHSVRVEVITGYGGVCTCCGTTHLPHLTLDHVNEDGAKHRQVENARKTFYRLRRMLREGLPLDPMFQVLCWNCNLAKHHYGFCGCQH